MTTTAPPTRADIEAQIAAAKARHDRMPEHWEARRLKVMRDIERLVDQWLAAEDGD